MGLPKPIGLPLIHQEKYCSLLRPKGLNPQVLSSAILNERIINNYQIYSNRDEVTHLYFYGAGLGIQSTVDRIHKVFKEIFTNCEFIIKEDTYAAVYSTAAMNEPSIVCILGTGSNCPILMEMRLSNA